MTLAKLQPAMLNTTKLVAFVLVAVGIVAFAYEGIRVKSADYAVDLGSMHVTAERSNALPLPLLVGFAALLGGIGTLLAAAKYNDWPAIPREVRITNLEKMKFHKRGETE